MVDDIDPFALDDLELVGFGGRDMYGFSGILTIPHRISTLGYSGVTRLFVLMC